MATIANPVNTVTITASTVAGAVGLCYFDPLTEELLEISEIPNHFLTVQPFQQVVRKYYLVVAPGESLSYVQVRIHGEGLEDLYSIKSILSNAEPTSDSFSVIPDFNGYRVNSPTAGEFIPLHVLISSKTPVNEILNVSIDIEYE
jgi:hypothetical protein